MFKWLHLQEDTMKYLDYCAIGLKVGPFLAFFFLTSTQRYTEVNKGAMSH